jgi:pimeloyl-ACP methyl ester carboxylesterase
MPLPHELKEARLSEHSLGLYTYFLKPQHLHNNKLTAVIMHGGGESTNSTSYDKFAQLFADNGVAVVSLDFVGHGKTGGAMTDNSLSLRLKHALATIEHWTNQETPLILVGYSMSAHTAMRLAPLLGKRVQGIGLICPATYAAEAEDTNFGPDFSKILRTDHSWRNSQGLTDLANFTGRTLIVTGAHDDVVDWEITSEMIARAKANSNQVRVEILGGRDHHLVQWLSEHPTFSEQLVHYFLEDLL